MLSNDWFGSSFNECVRVNRYCSRRLLAVNRDNTRRHMKIEAEVISTLQTKLVSRL